MRTRLDNVLRNVIDLPLVEQGLGELNAALDVSRMDRSGDPPKWRSVPTPQRDNELIADIDFALRATRKVR